MERPKVLVVDDSVIVRKTLANILKELDLEIFLTSNGQEALEIAMKEPLDLIITDIDMPEMSGFDLCKRIKSIPKTKSIPVVILSTHDKENDVEKGFQVGAASFVSKINFQSQIPKLVKELIKKTLFFRNQKILVVNESEFILDFIKEGLIKEGFNVFEIKNAFNALKILKKEKIDLIISDIETSEMDGLTFAKMVRSIEGYLSIPIIILYSETNNISIKRILNCGASACIVKPFNIEQLTILVEKVLSENFLVLVQEKERLELEQRHMIASITSLTHALEARDMYTRGHSENVAKMLSTMARFSGFNDHEIEILTIAARLHDIGKIGIPDYVLLKPGPLDENEFKIIQQHPVIGADIIRPISSLKDAIPVILNHHERFDGKGYPEGLKGADIPLWARMASVVDVYDALTSDRSYRKAMSKDEALEIIINGKGRQFCPDCVDLFLKSIIA